MILNNNLLFESLNPISISIRSWMLSTQVLTFHRKSDIRPLSFLSLPPELRNQVFGHLLVASYIDEEKNDSESEESDDEDEDIDYA